MKKNVDGHLKIGHTTMASITCIYFEISRINGSKANINARRLYDDLEEFDSPFLNSALCESLFCSIRFRNIHVLCSRSRSPESFPRLFSCA